MMASAFNDDGGAGLASLIRWDAPATGAYYLAVRAFSSFSQFGTYQLVGTSSFLLGDVSQDGSVNFSDISPFISLLTTGDYLAEGDINGDGLVDFSDISPFIALLT